MKREYAWCVVQVGANVIVSMVHAPHQLLCSRCVFNFSMQAAPHSVESVTRLGRMQVDRTNFQMRNALWGEAHTRMRRHEMPTTQPEFRAGLHA